LGQNNKPSQLNYKLKKIKKGNRKMKTFRKITGTFFTGLLLTGLTLNFNACSEQSPLGSTSIKNPQTVLNKVSKNESEETLDTTEQGSMLSRYYKKWDEYQGGKIILSHGSQFELFYGSLTPPAELQGQSVTLTMTAVQTASNELLFEFGPHGSQFDPPATVWFHYTGSNPKLYYVQEDGSYIEQQPDEVDSKNQWLMLKINHFSRYALAWSR